MPQTIQDWLTNATARLTDAGVDTARLDALVLLEDHTAKDRAHLLAHPETILSEEQTRALDKAVSRRTGHEPLAYIRGFAEFYGHRFTVTADVLVPRPESEAIIDFAVKLGVRQALDIGTGSGCLGISLKLERPDIGVTITDIDETALAVAARNAQGLGADVVCRLSDLLGGLTGSYDLVLANLPYVPTGYPINQAAGHEPELALFSGEDGLDHYRRLLRQLGGLENRVTHILAESLPRQHEGLADLAGAAGYSLDETHGFVQHFVDIRG